MEKNSLNAFLCNRRGYKSLKAFLVLLLDMVGLENCV